MNKQNRFEAPRILVGDDKSDILKALRLLLVSEGYEVMTTSSAEGVADAVANADFDAVLIDLNYARGNTCGKEGLSLLSRIQQIDSALPVVVMTAWSSVELAVEAMRRGARDFVPKPWENERLLAILRTQVELSRVLRRQRHAFQRRRMDRLRRMDPRYRHAPCADPGAGPRLQLHHHHGRLGELVRPDLHRLLR